MLLTTMPICSSLEQLVLSGNIWHHSGSLISPFPSRTVVPTILLAWVLTMVTDRRGVVMLTGSSPGTVMLRSTEHMASMLSARPPITIWFWGKRHCVVQFMKISLQLWGSVQLIFGSVHNIDMLERALLHFVSQNTLVWDPATPFLSEFPEI